MIESLVPLSAFPDLVLLAVRIVLAMVMLYYGFQKVRDPKANAKDFDGMGFHPGWFWGTIMMLVEVAGGLLILIGFYVWVAAALAGFTMIVGTMWKISKKKGFEQWSYDILMFALALVLLTFGPGVLVLFR